MHPEVVWTCKVSRTCKAHDPLGRRRWATIEMDMGTWLLSPCQSCQRTGHWELVSAGNHKLFTWWCRVPNWANPIILELEKTLPEGDDQRLNDNPNVLRHQAFDSMSQMYQISSASRLTDNHHQIRKCPELSDSMTWLPLHSEDHCYWWDTCKRSQERRVLWRRPSIKGRGNAFCLYVSFRWGWLVEWIPDQRVSYLELLWNSKAHGWPLSYKVLC